MKRSFYFILALVLLSGSFVFGGHKYNSSRDRSRSRYNCKREFNANRYTDRNRHLFHPYSNFRSNYYRKPVIRYYVPPTRRRSYFNRGRN